MKIPMKSSTKTWQQILDHPLIWETSRIGLDLAIGLYRKRIKLMEEWRLLENAPSIVDIGCGIGQYAHVTQGRYLGIDLNSSYITHARKKRRRENQTFRCEDVTRLLDEPLRFDLALMVDFLHHLSDDQTVHILTVASHLVRRSIVSFEPVTYQPNPVGRWIVENDRGYFVRSLDRLHHLFSEAGLSLLESVELRLGPINTRAILAAPVSVSRQ